MNVLTASYLLRLRCDARIVALLLVLVGLGMSSPVRALPNFPPIVIELYHPAADSAIDKAAKDCSLCHEGGPPKLNPYGMELRKALKAAQTKQLTAAILKS